MAAALEDTARPEAPPPAEFGGDLVTWAMWLYYGEARTQNEIARSLGVSRASVANYLAEARRRGLVNISIAPDTLARVGLAQRLAARYGLAGAHVLPADPEGGAEAAALRRRLGAAAAQMLPPFLEDGMVLGVAWGRTMLELARALPERSLPRATVAQVSGSSLGDAETSPEACTALIAGRLGARCRNLHAPAVVGTEGLRDALMAEPTVARHFELTSACDAVVFGVGEISRTTTWVDTDYITETVAADYVERGAVGVLIGRFVDEAGREVAGPLAGRQIGMELDRLAAAKTRICVSGGPPKLDATRATLAGGYATHFVTDAPTAAALLGEGT
ncbi:MAG: sugar-binding transcriptional regulator [Pseudomonadota bacterium]